MNKLFLINDDYYVIAFDYYDAIVKFQEYKDEYDENIIEKIKLVSDNVIEKKKNKEDVNDVEIIGE